MTEDGNFRLGEWMVEPELDRISQGDRRVQLQPQVMDLLVYLARRRKAVVGIEELLSEVWRGRVVTKDSIYSSVKQLRDVLGDDIRDPRYIRTIPKKGYRLVAEVEYPESPKSIPATEGAGAPLRKTRLSSRVAAVLAVAVAIMVTMAILRSHFVNSMESRTALARTSTASLAVLPFMDMSQGRDQEWLCDGMTDSILDKLARIPGLTVADRTATFQFRELPADLASVGHSLNVAHLLHGDVSWEGDQLLIHVQLVRAMDGYLVWTQEYDLEIDDIFAIQDDISGHVVSELQLQPVAAFTAE